MKTNHNIYIHPSQHMVQIDENTIDLVVTSPPYPMIEMWDEILGEQNPNILECLENEPEKAFEMMHQELDKVWKECFRVIKPGGFLCINIGDATRTIMASLLSTITIATLPKLVLTSDLLVYQISFGENKQMHQINLWEVVCYLAEPM